MRLPIARHSIVNPKNLFNGFSLGISLDDALSYLQLQLLYALAQSPL